MLRVVAHVAHGCNELVRQAPFHREVVALGIRGLSRWVRAAHCEISDIGGKARCNDAGESVRNRDSVRRAAKRAAASRGERTSELEWIVLAKVWPVSSALQATVEDTVSCANRGFSIRGPGDAQSRSEVGVLGLDQVRIGDRYQLDVIARENGSEIWAVARAVDDSQGVAVGLTS